MSDTLKRISGPMRDVIAAAVVFISAASAGAVYVATYQPVPYFLQHMFGPAVMWACVRGFENPKLSEAPALEDFLYWRKPCFECGDLPPDLPVVPPDPFSLSDAEWRAYHPHAEYAGWTNCQQFHKYMLMSSAGLWRVAGVSWKALLPLYALLYGSGAAAAYGIFRLAMRRPLAFVTAMLLAFAPLQLQQLPDLRDYAKAPFFLGAIFIMGLLASRPMRARHALALSAVGGLILGIGVGFRQDALICVPAFAATVLFFFPGGIKETWKIRTAGLALFFAVFMISGGPILKVLFTRGNNSTHDTLIGFTRYCDDRLGVGSPVYDFGDPFLDEYTRAVVESFNYRTAGGTKRLRHYTHEYDLASSEYFRTLAATFPGDLVTRAYASTLRVLDELRASSPVPRGIENAALLSLYDAHSLVSRLLLSYGRYVAALALLLIAAANLRLGLCALFLFCWFAGYPSLRFSVRHAFHLQFISFFFAGLLIQQGLQLLRAAWCKELRFDGRKLRKALVRAAVFAGITLAGLAGLLAALRIYQDACVCRLLAQYESAARVPVEYAISQTDNETLIKLAETPPDNPELPIQTQLLAVEFNQNEVNLKSLRLLYDVSDPMWDFSRIIDIKASSRGGKTTAYIPVYYNSSAALTGIALAKHISPDSVKFYNVDADSIPVLLTATLADNWRDQPLHYQILR